MRKVFILSILLGIFSVAAYSQKNPVSTTENSAHFNISKEATIAINFLNLPGKENAKSTWEVSYELRIIDGKSHFEASKSGKLKQMSIENEKIGELILKGAFKKTNLSKQKNRQEILTIAFDEQIQAKLRDTQKLKQTFLFYCSAIIYDGKLKKNIIIPLGWIWRYENYPDAKFGMEFSIEESSGESGYSYNRKTFVPEKKSEIIINLPKL